MTSLPPLFATPALQPQLELIIASYKRLTGRDLVAPGESLWDAPRAIVAHGIEADPIFFFGNRMALERFEMTPEQFARTPSRFSAEPLAREERQVLLDRVTRHGFIDDYAGIRISASGRRFRIEAATVWNLLDAEGAIHGQAATFDRWSEL